ncbi:MAG: protein translocase subunit SecD [Candidatus Omnitrophica bacterium]|nr:protein translocase subunit SecD [Candidatus Omnitrophota bacterium]MCB9721781.1 protein translocase subunit SecD [Candidatus Omnitrophota bacterium]
MKKELRNKLLTVAGVIIASGLLAWFYPFTKGIDLAGGMHLVLQVESDARTISNSDVTEAGLDWNEFSQKLLKAKLAEKTKVSEKIRLTVDYKTDSRKLTEILGADVMQKALPLFKDAEQPQNNAQKDAVPRAIEILRNRIDGMGVGETVIQQVGDDQIMVQLPGITDREKAHQLIGTTAKMEFHMVSDNPALVNKALEGTIPKGYVLRYTRDENDPVLLEADSILDGENIKDAQPNLDQGNQPIVSMSFDSVGAKKFADITRKNVGRRLAIVMDNQVLSAPVINEPILGGNGQISGNFTFEEAQLLALSLRSGALPVDMHIEEERTVGALLGEDSIIAGISAAVMGGVLVFLFMLFYYLAAGVLSCFALAVNILLIFGIAGFLNATLPASQLTLTLPGIAGIILTMGMAVDANVLINERIREELLGGRNLAGAVHNGFDKALKAIVDSNTTTLIAAFMLFQFGSGPIKGFAVTLSIGLVASLFTALYVTRTFFELALHLKLIKKLKMLRFFTDTNIDFVSKRFICFVISGVLAVASVVALIQKKDAAYGIDFAGGQFQEYQFDKPIQVDLVRQALADTKYSDAVIQQFEQHRENVIIRTATIDTGEQGSESVEGSITTALTKAFPGQKVQMLRVEAVGPVVGKALIRAALMAIFFALGGILIYVGFRFHHFDFATAGIIALLHDVFITLGLLVMLNRQVDLLVVTALLTIAGYSINDTIIIYDRVRENMAVKGKKKLADIINASINQTLGRTILTTLTTLLVVCSLYFKGGEVLNTFALTLLIGFVAGTYSTIFIASPLVLAWESQTKKKK